MRLAELNSKIYKEGIDFLKLKYNTFYLLYDMLSKNYCNV